MTEPILHFHRELSDLISSLRGASHKMTPEDRFKTVKEIVTASTERLKNYREQNPTFSNHPTLRATESLVGYLSYLYENTKEVSRAEAEIGRKSGTPANYLKPIIDYLEFIERETPL